ncbi:LysM domain [Syntrophomonas zehnderi OL-4]|uniref:LysM domain n=1 Tax=Syntrophomonas zehnderi OL-4 TaxID=690567 RepID=A0A0E3W3H9_9FIRM|nr:peptidoglycan-binding protein [Syntrophomonas zehnderi]CFX84129.1 LysM domain [Syntrophomonas zehnderi OL-4]
MTKKRKNFVVTAVILAFMVVSMVPGQALAGNYGTSLLKYGSRGQAVYDLQQDLTALGFNTYGIDGIFGPKTQNAVIAFQKSKWLAVDGIVGNQTKAALYNSLGAKRTYTLKLGDSLSGVAAKYGVSLNDLMQANGLSSCILNPGVVLVIPAPANIGARNPEMADWWTVVNKAFPRKTQATVTDIDTGITFNIYRYGGSNHADVEPVTAADTAKMKQAYGGQWSWNRRAVIVNVNGRVFAGSMNGMPHGGQDIYNNNFDGQFCIHFLNSRTHGTNRVDAAHQAAVYKAGNYKY